MQTQILGLVTPLMALFFAATFALLWRVGRMKRYVLGFALAYLFFPIGFLVTHLLPPEAIYTFHITHACYTIATTCMMAAICERAGLRFHLPTAAGIYAVSALALAVAVSLSNDIGPRVIIENVGYGLIMFLAFSTLLPAKRHGLIDLVILVMMGLGAIDFLMRPVLTMLVEGSIPAEVYRDSISYSLIGLVLGVKAASSALVLIGATIADLTIALRENSERDPLTGLSNRGAFEETMRTLIARAQTEGLPLSLVVADIDHFKQVNDIWGHQAGDTAISAFGGLIRKMVRGCDVAGRIGGEEFCIAAWNCPNQPADRLAERIRQAFARLEHSGLNDDIRLTASFGVATARAGEDYEALFARADAALYEAKSSGRNRVMNAEIASADNDCSQPDPSAAKVEIAARQ